MLVSVKVVSLLTSFVCLILFVTKVCWPRACCCCCHRQQEHASGVAQEVLGYSFQPGGLWRKDILTAGHQPISN